jgi:excisionase family DNA binding protein
MDGDQLVNLGVCVVPEQLYNVGQVCAMLQVARSTIWKWIAERRFPAPVRVGPQARRWRASDLTHFLEGVGQRR